MNGPLPCPDAGSTRFASAGFALVQFHPLSGRLSAVCDPASERRHGFSGSITPGAVPDDNKMENEMTNKNDNQPTHAIYQVIGDSKDATWIKVGAAWPNKDGKGFSIRLNAVPLTGHIAMREIADDSQEQEGSR